MGRYDMARLLLLVCVAFLVTAHGYTNGMEDHEGYEREWVEDVISDADYQEEELPTSMIDTSEGTYGTRGNNEYETTSENSRYWANLIQTAMYKSAQEKTKGKAKAAHAHKKEAHKKEAHTLKVAKTKTRKADHLAHDKHTHHTHHKKGKHHLHHHHKHHLVDHAKHHYDYTEDQIKKKGFSLDHCADYVRVGCFCRQEKTVFHTPKGDIKGPWCAIACAVQSTIVGGPR